MLITSNVQLHNGQKKAKDLMLRHPVKYNIVKSSRQAGKSVFGLLMLINYSINNKNKCLWTSPTNAQALKAYREFSNALPNNIVKKRNDTRREVILLNGSFIEFKGVEKPDNIRGDNTDIFILDEFAFYKSSVWPILKPFLLTKPNATCIIISTPRGCSGDFWNLYNLGIEQNGRYRSYEWNYKDNPYCDLLEIDDAKKELPDAMFRQEYLGEFVRDGSSVFNNIELCANVTQFSYPDANLTYYNGNDLAKQKDFTVSTTMNNKGEVSNIYRANRMDWNQIVDGVVKQLDLYKPKLSFFEVNGVGDPTFDFVRAKYEMITPFVMNNQRKQNIVRELTQSFNLKNISIPTRDLMPSLHEQLNAFTFTYSQERRQIMYQAADGYHDDDVISLALANHAWYMFHGRK